MLSKLKLPVVEPYYGKIDPREPKETFIMSMQLHGVTNQILCGAFPTTPKETAKEWYHQLPPDSAKTFNELAKLFCGYFMGCHRTKRTSKYLITAK